MIKVAFCVAYDWYYLRHSLPLIYAHADTICLAIDKDRISWMGNPFEFDEVGFRKLIREIDVNKKIQIFEENFHLPELKPMENEVRQRNMMADFMGKGDGWHIQIDSDEYFLDFGKFVDYLKKFKPQRATNICCPWITLYKRIDEGFLMVNPNTFEQIEFISIATNKPHYEHGRRNGYFNHYVDSPILHQSWARTDKEVWQKLNNWGHRFDSDIAAYFNLWKNADKNNYNEYKNFNQVKPSLWPELKLLPLEKEKEIGELIANGEKLAIKINPIQLWWRNSIWVSRFKKVLKIGA